MNIIADREKMREYFSVLGTRAEAKPLCETIYLDLGVKIIRVLCYDEDAVSLIRKQMEYVVRENSANYDATVVVWREENVEGITKALMHSLSLEERMQLRIETLCCKKKEPTMQILENGEVNRGSVFLLNGEEKRIEAFN